MTIKNDFSTVETKKDTYNGEWVPIWVRVNCKSRKTSPYYIERFRHEKKRS